MEDDVEYVVDKVEILGGDHFNGTMQNRFLNLDNFFIFLAYDDLIVGISDGANCFW